MNKLLSTVLAVGVLSTTSLTPAVFADVTSTTLPNLSSATNADVTTSGSNMNVQITAGQGGVGTLNWNSYNIGSDASVNYEFTAHNQTALNKVAASGGLSQIYGSITASGCSGCDYAGTGKVILINPNGILFGDGANVNLNSFTATTFDGTYDEESNTLSLTRSSDSGDITVLGGATIYGEKNVTLAATNISTYAGSKITTSVAPNVGSDSYGKVKLVTADGVNFTYYNNGAVKSLSDIQGSADKMVITLNGEIDAGHIDIRNYSTDSNSQINLKNSVLKATKAVSGNDGNIWLTAANDIIIEDSTLETVNYSDDASSVSGGNVRLVAGNKVSLGTTDIDSVGNVVITSQGDDIAFDASTIDAAKDVTLSAANIASVQNGSTINAEGDVTIYGGTRSQVNASKVNAKNITLESDGTMVWTNNAELTAAQTANLIANNGYLLLNDSIVTARKINLTSNDSITSKKLSGSEFSADTINVTSTGDSVVLNSLDQFKYANTDMTDGTLLSVYLTAAKDVELNYENDLTLDGEDKFVTLAAGNDINLISQNGSVSLNDSVYFKSAENINIQAANDVKTEGNVSTCVIPGEINLNGIKTNITAGNDIDVTLTGVDSRENGLVAQAGNNMTITTEGTLSVSSLISGNDMTINANKVIAGEDYTTVEHLNGETGVNRSYIEVGGEFYSNVTEDNYEVTASGEISNDGQYYQKHHIQYGEDEKILLVQNRPVEDDVTDPTIPDADNGSNLDVVEPGDFEDNTQPSTGTGSDTPSTGGDGSGSSSGDDNTGSSGDDNTGSGDESCDDQASGDTVQEEDAPDLGITSLTSITSYTASAVSQE